MCIRDSNFGIFVIENGSAITSNNGNVTLNGIGGGSGSSTGNYGIIAVSYTHLTLPTSDLV